AYAAGALIGAVSRAGEAAHLIPAMVLVAGIALAATRMQAEGSKDAGPDGSGGALPLAVILPSGAIVLIAFMTEGAIETWSALHIERTLDGGAAEGPLGPAVLGLTMGVGRALGQVATGKMGNRALLLLGTGLSILGALAAALSVAPWMAYISFGCLGLGVSVIAPTALAMAGNRLPEENRTRAIARIAVIGFSGFMIGPFLLGLVSEVAGLRAAFACVAVILLVLWPLTSLVTQKPKVGVP
ncbi:MAG: MFS transporter, partial [Planctomycetota bacterium]